MEDLVSVIIKVPDTYSIFKLKLTISKKPTSRVWLKIRFWLKIDGEGICSQDARYQYGIRSPGGYTNHPYTVDNLRQRWTSNTCHIHQPSVARWFASLKKKKKSLTTHSNENSRTQSSALHDRMKIANPSLVGLQRSRRAAPYNKRPSRRK